MPSGSDGYVVCPSSAARATPRPQTAGRFEGVQDDLGRAPIREGRDDGVHAGVAGPAAGIRRHRPAQRHQWQAVAAGAVIVLLGDLLLAGLPTDAGILGALPTLCYLAGPALIALGLASLATLQPAAVVPIPLSV